MSDKKKSLIIGETVHYVVKKYCAENGTNIRAFVEKLILEATNPKVKSKKQKP